MPFVLHLVDAHVAIPVLTILSLVFSTVLALMDRKRIIWSEVFRIAMYLALGAPFGILFFKHLSGEVYKPAMGTLIVLIALWGLLRLVSARVAAVDLPLWSTRLLLLVAGITQGAFGSSGPFVIPYAEKVLNGKSEFRTTLTAMWAVINAIVLPQYFLAGTSPSEVLHLSLTSLPAIFLGLFAGLAAHHRINRKNFSLLVYSILLFSGLFNLLSV